MATTNKLLCLLLLVVTAGCSHTKIDTAAARKLSDDFMADLIAHRTDAALDKMEPEFIGTINRSDFAPQLEKLSQYCGWPLDSQFKDVQAGYKIYRDGHKNPTRKFIYATTTNQAPKGQCFFSVEVAPSAGSVKVTGFGPLKVTSGNPFP
jgi:hypothetical protein